MLHSFYSGEKQRVHFFHGVAYLQAHVYAQNPIKPQMYTILETYTSPPLTSNPRIFITKIKSWNYSSSGEL